MPKASITCNVCGEPGLEWTRVPPVSATDKGWRLIDPKTGERHRHRSTVHPAALDATVPKPFVGENSVSALAALLDEEDNAEEALKVAEALREFGADLEAFKSIKEAVKTVYDSDIDL